MNLATGASWVSLAEAAALAALLVGSRRRFLGSTLLAPWAWATGSAVLLGSAALVPLGADVGRTPSWYVATMSTFCPLMALLGAKRPQHAAWQWIVGSLWLILCLPAFEWWLFHGGQPRELHLARSFFLGLLAVIGMGNMLFTRYAVAAMLLGAGQLALIGPFVLGERLPASAALPALGLGCLLAATAAAGLAARRAPVATWPLNRVWIDFRDSYGAVWAVRQMDRVNAVARQQGWNLVLTWQGFEGPDGESINHLSAEQESELVGTLRSLLTRFVSPEWLASRLIEQRPQSADYSLETQEQ